MIQSINSKYIIKIQVFDYYESFEYFYAPEVRIFGFKLKPPGFRNIYDNDITQELPDNYILQQDIVMLKPHIILTLVNNETFTFHYETLKAAKRQASIFEGLTNSKWVLI